MNKNELMQAEDEVSLFELWETLRGGWRYVVAASLLGGTLAGVAIFLLPSKYEAIAIVQVGQVGQVGQAGGLPVESAQQAVERIKTPAFQRRVVERLAAGGVASAGTALSAQVIKSTVGTGYAPLIELKTTAMSTQGAELFTRGVIQELADTHAKLSEPMIQKMQEALLLAKTESENTEREIAALDATNAVKNSLMQLNKRPLIPSEAMAKNANRVIQRQAVLLFETALGSPATQPAKAIEAVFVAEMPVSPKKGLFLALGLIGGLLSGVMSVFVIDAWRRTKEARAIKTGSALLSR